MKNNKLTLWLGGGFAAVVVLFMAGFLVYSSICPCERTPGGFLFGERVDTAVTDWYQDSTANQEDLCQLQIWDGVRPHSINLNCMATPEGELYLSCSVCDSKYWASKVDPNERATLRLGNLIYPVTLNRETEPAAMARSWQARILKLQNVSEETMVTPRPPLDAQQSDRWWTFRVTSRT